MNEEHPLPPDLVKMLHQGIGKALGGQTSQIGLSMDFAEGDSRTIRIVFLPELQPAPNKPKLRLVTAKGIV